MSLRNHTFDKVQVSAPEVVALDVVFRAAFDVMDLT